MKSRAIAMWSGPRNISTAMMRSWESRADTFVCDEPFYAYYLKETGVDHPGRDAVLAAHESDWRKVVARLTGPVPGGKAVFYQKHMAHHLLPSIEYEWLAKLDHAFLVRDPREMIVSYLRVNPDMALADTGLPQQWELFLRIRDERGITPPVVDARDVLEDPRATLRALCAALDVPFDEAMLSWEAGRRDTDGVWAPYWYAAVERSTGFGPYRPRDEDVPPDYMPLHAQCRRYYDQLCEFRLRG